MATYNPACFNEGDPKFCTRECWEEVAKFHEIEEDKFNLLTKNGKSPSQTFPFSVISDIPKLGASAVKTGCIGNILIAAKGASPSVDVETDTSVVVHDPTQYSVVLFKGLLELKPESFTFQVAIAGPTGFLRNKLLIKLTFPPDSEPRHRYYDFAEAYP